MTLSRRSLITGLISLVAAPAIVRAGSLMPVKQMLSPTVMEDIIDITRRAFVPRLYAQSGSLRYWNSGEDQIVHWSNVPPWTVE
jgi:hypothetical protein